jgi:hypothetical protein
MTKAPRLRMLGNRVGTVANRMAPGPKVAAPLLKQSVYRKQKVLPEGGGRTGRARACHLTRVKFVFYCNNSRCHQMEIS